ncbi:MAG: hypothetical protein KJ592_00335 [Nanoarchaeota archaeon]|nr:hypothetical protein [Nanoarchaeota archaeon]
MTPIMTVNPVAIIQIAYSLFREREMVAMPPNIIKREPMVAQMILFFVLVILL